MHGSTLRLSSALVALPLLALPIVTGCTPKAGHVRFSHPGSQAALGQPNDLVPGEVLQPLGGKAPAQSARAQLQRSQGDFRTALRQR